MNKIKSRSISTRKSSKRKSEKSSSPSPQTSTNKATKKARKASHENITPQSTNIDTSSQVLKPQSGTPIVPAIHEAELTSKSSKPIVADTSMQVLSRYLKESAVVFSDDDYTISSKPTKPGLGKKVLIHCTNTAVKSKVSKILEDHQVNYHSFTEDSDKSVMFVLKGLDFEPIPAEILDMLQEKEVPATKVSVIFKGSDSYAPVFLVQFAKGSLNLAELNHRFKKIGHNKIYWEKPRSTAKKLTQCHNCQAWGHSSINCHRQPRCVKCTEHHSTADCPRKEKAGTAKCINCDGDHAANYRGCSAHKSYASLFKKKPSTEVIGKPAGRSLQPPPNLNDVTSFPHLEKRRHTFSAQPRINAARKLPDVQNSQQSTSQPQLMDASDESSDDEDCTQAVSFNRKPVKNCLKSRYEEARKFFEEDPGIAKAMKEFILFVDRLRNADHVGKIAILSEHYGLDHAH